MNVILIGMNLDSFRRLEISVCIERLLEFEFDDIDCEPVTNPVDGSQEEECSQPIHRLIHPTGEIVAYQPETKN